MKTKEFHISDVLSVTTERLVSQRGMDGVYDILNFMTGDELFTHQLPRAGDECKPYLLEQFPQLATSEMDRAVKELDKAIAATESTDKNEAIVTNWLYELISGKFGVKVDAKLTVKEIPTVAHTVKNPLDEAAEMMGGSEKIIPVVIG